jgi:arylsulfatase A-like enzyme
MRGKGNARRAYWVNREFRNPEREEDYPTPQCFLQAIDFLEHNHSDDNWHLHLEVFDPHEPFDCPQKYLDMYNDTWDRYFYTWPVYGPVESEDDAEAIAHIRKCYAGSLTMADYWLGRLFGKMDELGLWQDTTVIFTTDHGHLLGEHGYWAKNYMMDYTELARIPLIISSPECTPGNRVQALTATIDLMPTCLELYGLDAPEHVHGKSLRELVRSASNPEAQHHDAVLYGYFGKDINLADGRYTYCRQPQADAPVYHYTAMPRAFHDFIDRPTLAAAECGVFLKHTHGIPHFKIKRPSQRHKDAPDFNPIYDLETDPRQGQPIHDDALEAQLADKMQELLQRYDAPECQFTRCGF